jgi:hypothetical protein
LCPSSLCCKNKTFRISNAMMVKDQPTQCVKCISQLSKLDLQHVHIFHFKFDQTGKWFIFLQILKHWQRKFSNGKTWINSRKTSEVNWNPRSSPFQPLIKFGTRIIISNRNFCGSWKCIHGYKYYRRRNHDGLKWWIWKCTWFNSSQMWIGFKWNWWKCETIWKNMKNQEFEQWKEL